MIGWLRGRRRDRARRSRAGGDAKPRRPHDSMWLTLYEQGDASAQVEVSRRWAHAATVDDFAALYRTTVASCSTREAELWAREQVQTREAVMSA